MAFSTFLHSSARNGIDLLVPRTSDEYLVEINKFLKILQSSVVNLYINLAIAGDRGQLPEFLSNNHRYCSSPPYGWFSQSWANFPYFYQDELIRQEFDHFARPLAPMRIVGFTPFCDCQISTSSKSDYNGRFQKIVAASSLSWLTSLERNRTDSDW